MELILIRHGTTQGNLERRFIGTLDVPLLPQGEELARREAVGRLCCRLAARAARVERIFCGLPMVLKGEGPWN